MNSANRPTDAYAIAGLNRQTCMDAVQEEVYLEEVEEELRILLISSDAPEHPDQNKVAVLDKEATPTSQLALAIEVLIAGEPDDMPLDREVVGSLVQQLSVKVAQLE